ncbi:Hypothetical protein FKW44_011837, partial [Caligus rogercresseyi]
FMEKRIKDSLAEIIDGNHFTAQLLISANIIRFYRPCKDCGTIIPRFYTLSL